MTDPSKLAAPDDRAYVSAEIDRLADQFEASWIAGAPLEIAACVAGAAGPLRSRLATELIYLDIEYRTRRGTPKPIEQYLRECPDFAPDAKVHAELVAFAAETDRKYVTQTAKTAWSAPVTTGIPEQIGRYKIVKQLSNQSGQADIYLAEHPVSKTPVVLKLWRVDGGDADAHERFLKEGTILSEVIHPNIARVYDMDFHNGQPFLAMEFIRGRTLDQVAAGTMDWRQVVRIVAQAAGALKVIHARGVLHLDITPRNLIVDETGAVKLIDFGLSRLRGAWQQDLHQTGFVSGSPAYLSPEQANGDTEHLDARTDVFGLGTVLYSLLTGQSPYRGKTVSEVLIKARAGDVDPQPLQQARAPRWLKRTCRKAISASPASRYPSADAFEATLRHGLVVRPRLFVAIAAAALLGISLIAWRPWAPRPVVVQASALADPTLAIYRKDSQGDYRKVTSGLTVTKTDRLYFESQVPTGVYAAMVLFSPSDPPKIVQHLTPTDLVRELRYPSLGAAKELVIDDAVPGTAIVLVLTSTTGPIQPDDFQHALTERDAWPTLQPNSTLRFTSKELGFVEEPRGFNLVPAGPDANPDEATRQRLDALRHQLMGKYPAFQGVAFRHQPKATE